METQIEGGDKFDKEAYLRWVSLKMWKNFGVFVLSVLIAVVSFGAPYFLGSACAMIILSYMVFLVSFLFSFEAFSLIAGDDYSLNTYLRREAHKKTSGIV